MATSNLIYSNADTSFVLDISARSILSKLKQEEAFGDRQSPLSVFSNPLLQSGHPYIAGHIARLLHVLKTNPWLGSQSSNEGLFCAVSRHLEPHILALCGLLSLDFFRLIPLIYLLQVLVRSTVRRRDHREAEFSIIKVQ